MTLSSGSLDLADFRVQLAEVNGKLDVIAARMEAGDMSTTQLVGLVRDQLTFHAADLGELKAIVREISASADRGISTVRVDLESKINTLTGDVGDLKLWRARIGGIAIGAAALSSVMTAAVTKLIGA